MYLLSSDEEKYLSFIPNENTKHLLCADIAECTGNFVFFSCEDKNHTKVHSISIWLGNVEMVHHKTCIIEDSCSYPSSFLF